LENIDFTLCVTNVLLLEKALKHISHLYFFTFLAFLISLLEFFDWRKKFINEDVDGIGTLLFDILGRIGGGISSGGRRNGNVCQKDRNGRNKARCEWKSFDKEINGGKKGFEIGNNSLGFVFSDWFDFIDDIEWNADLSSDAK